MRNSAALLSTCLAALACAQERDERFPFHPPGWDNPKNWSGEHVKVEKVYANNRNALCVTWQEDSEITLRLESALEFRGVANMGLSLEIGPGTRRGDDNPPALSTIKGLAWEVVARKPDDIAGQRIGVLEQPDYHYPGYHLLNAKKSFRQITFKPNRAAGSVNIYRLAFNQREDHLLLRYRRPAAALLCPGEGPEPDDGLSALLKTEGVGTIKDASDWALRRAEIAAAWQTVLGKGPAARGELELEVLESAEFGDYHRRKLRFVSEGEDKIECFLLVPKSYREGASFPAVVCLPRETWAKMDETIGLADDGGLAHAIHLVKEGYVTVAFNCFAFRGQSVEPAADLKRRHAGWTGLGKMVFDVGRAIDLLESFPFVDKKAIGVVGHGLGGKQALAAAALDPRIACAVVSEAGLSLTGGEWFKPVLLGEDRRESGRALDGHQLLALAAPRPVLVIGGDAADGAKSVGYLEHAGRVYRLLGAADKLALYNHKAGGGFPIVARSEAYQWLEKHLKKKTE